jgi:hypothetical protein
LPFSSVGFLVRWELEVLVLVLDSFSDSEDFPPHAAIETLAPIAASTVSIAVSGRFLMGRTPLQLEDFGACYQALLAPNRAWIRRSPASETEG